MSKTKRRPQTGAAKTGRKAGWPVIALVVVAVVATGGWVTWDRMAASKHNMPTVSAAMHGGGAGAAPMPADKIVVPKLSAAAEMGRQVFAEKCATCHGENAAGTDQGPPFVHRIYEPSHHADFAWVRAVRNGVRAHHWRYGDMPPVDGVTDKQIAWIVAYVRDLQRANGID